MFWGKMSIKKNAKENGDKVEENIVNKNDLLIGYYKFPVQI